MRPCRTTTVHNNHDKHVAETFDGQRREERAGKKELMRHLEVRRWAVVG